MTLVGLNYFGARYYDADIGLWTSVDPMREFWSGYSYMGNGRNPINAIDPNGLSTHIWTGKDNEIFKTEYQDDGKPDLIVHTAYDWKVYEGALLEADNYFNSENILGKIWYGDVQSSLDAMQSNAMGMAHSDAALNFGNKGDFDFKYHFPNGVGIAYGKAMTTRDAGNALWGHYVISRYPSWWYIYAKGAAGAYQTHKGGFKDWKHLGEDTQSGNMNNWGAGRALGYH